MPHSLHKGDVNGYTKKQWGGFQEKRGRAF